MLSTECLEIYFSNIFLGWNSTCFEQFLCPSSGVFHCKHSNGICHITCEQDQDGTAVPYWSCSQVVWHIPLLCVQWKIDDGQRNCPKHVEFYSKNKFEKLVHLVGFIIRIYHDARSPERHYITMHGHLNVTISRYTVTWTSLYYDARSPERHYITMHGHLNVTISRCTVTWTSLYHDARSPERTINKFIVAVYSTTGSWDVEVVELQAFTVVLDCNMK